MEPRADEADRPDERRMSFFEHLEELRQRLRMVVLVFLVAFVGMFVLSVQPIPVGDTTIYLPLPTAQLDRNIPQQFFNVLRESLIQGSATPITLGPADAVIVQMKVAMFLAAVIVSPVTTYEVWRFVAPAVKPNERRLILRITLPVVVLFLSGVLLSLTVILPFTFPFLYSFATAMGATPFVTLDGFLDFVLWFSIAFGLAFELPVVMYALSYLGIVAPDFWKKNWRYATIAIFIFGAIVTPDGSGITMLLVAFPMLFLYVAGYVAVTQRNKHAASQHPTPAKSS